MIGPGPSWQEELCPSAGRDDRPEPTGSVTLDGTGNTGHHPPVVASPREVPVDTGGRPQENDREPRTGPRPIVVGVDGSASSRRALAWAIGEAELRGCAVRVVSAWSYEPLSEFAFTSHRQVEEDLLALLHREVAEVTRDRAHPPVVEYCVVEGPAAGALLDEAEDAELLVVGNHRGGLLREVVLGSVSAACVRRAPCPVVVIPTPRRPERHHHAAMSEVPSVPVY